MGVKNLFIDLQNAPIANRVKFHFRDHGQSG